MAKNSLFFGGTIGGARTEDGEEAALDEDRRKGGLLHPGGEQGIQERKTVQRATFRLEQGTFLEYLPHHLVPFAGSSYRQESVSTLVVWTPTPEGA